MAQAKRYTAKLAVRFPYSTNGQAVYGIDMATGAGCDRIPRTRTTGTGKTFIAPRSAAATAGASGSALPASYRVIPDCRGAGAPLQ